MHKADACVVSCIDFRFHDQIQTYLKENDYLGKCDELSIAGCTRDFVKPVEEGDGKYVWKQLELSVKLHDPDKIVFIDHQDCGGYAQDGTIPNELKKENDMKEHKVFVEKLQAKLEEKHPSKELIFLYASLDGEVQEL